MFARRLFPVKGCLHSISYIFVKFKFSVKIFTVQLASAAELKLRSLQGGGGNIEMSKATN